MATAQQLFQPISSWPLHSSWESCGATALINPGLQITSLANATLSKETLTTIGTRTTIYKGDKQWLIYPWHCLRQSCEFHPNVFSQCTCSFYHTADTYSSIWSLCKGGMKMEIISEKALKKTPTHEIKGKVNKFSNWESSIYYAKY